MRNEYSAYRAVGRFLFYSFLILGEWALLAWYVFCR